MELQKLASSDFEFVFNTLYENAKWLESEAIVQWPLDWLSQQKSSIEVSLRAGHFFKLIESDHVIGVVEIKSEPEEIWGYDKSDCLYIHKLSVRRQFAKKNLGSKTLESIKIIAQEKGIQLLRLDCVAHNLKLRDYYLSQGFKLIKVVPTPLVDLALLEFKIKT